MLKTIIRKKKQNIEAFQALRVFFFKKKKLKRLTQNSKIELERFWVGLGLIVEPNK